MKRDYDRESAVEYAHKWAFGRNPKYYDFEKIGGDCTNFASQVIFAGAKIMNPTPTVGWYYYDINRRSPSWTGVEYLYQFLVNNHGLGPVAENAPLYIAKAGDVIQLSFDGKEFKHSPVIVSVGRKPSPENILVATHSYDSDNRALNTYIYEKLRLLHISHVNL